MKFTTNFSDSGYSKDFGATSKILRIPAYCIKRHLENSKFPKSWKLATIIPMPKRGKYLYALNYHPIILTSGLCKIMEQMVNKRQVWFIESNNLFTNIQRSLKSRISTTDHVIRLETSIREEIIEKHLVAIILWLKEGIRDYWEVWVSWMTYPT